MQRRWFQVFFVMRKVALVSCVVVAGCMSDLEASGDELSVISVKELIDNELQYDYKKVRVRGYINFGFEGCSMTPEDPDVEKTTSLNYVVWYWNDSCMGSGTSSRHGYGVIQGIFDKDDTGYLAAYRSGIAGAEIQWEEGSREAASKGAE